MTKNSTTGTTNNSMTLGTPDSTVKYIYFNKNGENKPGFRYNGSIVQYSHDGVTWAEVGSGGSGEGITIYPLISGETLGGEDSSEEKGRIAINTSEHSGATFVLYITFRNTDGATETSYIDLYNNEARSVVTNTDVSTQSTLYTTETIELTPGIGGFTSGLATYIIRLRVTTTEASYNVCTSAYIKVGDFTIPEAPVG